MSLIDIANKTIARATYKDSLIKKGFSTADIMVDVMDCYKQSNYQVKDFAPYLKGKTLTQTCSNVWHFVKNNIRYVEDPEGYQWVRTPARLWADGEGDCKSFTVMVASLLHHCGIDGVIRFASYSKTDEIPTHVYVVVPTNNGLIIVDPVYYHYNAEKPYQHKYDYSMSSLMRLSGIPQQSILAGIGCQCSNVLSKYPAQRQPQIAGWGFLKRLWNAFVDTVTVDIKLVATAFGFENTLQSILKPVKFDYESRQASTGKEQAVVEAFKIYVLEQTGRTVEDIANEIDLCEGEDCGPVDTGNGTGNGGSGTGTGTNTPPKKAGFPWWLLLLGGGAYAISK